jgi:hypothetical protein
MGKEGKVYNVLSDKGLQYNAKFVTPANQKGNKNVTVIDKAGITSGKDQLEFDHGGTAPTLNGVALQKNKAYTLDNNGHAKWDGSSLSFNNKEYEINLSNDPHDASAILSNVNIKKGANPLADGVSPHGLLGQTADGVAGAHKGKNNTGDAKQGGTVIDGTVGQYEVGTGLKTDEAKLFDTSFTQFNKFNS